MKSRIFSFDMMKTSSRKQVWIPCLLGLCFFLAFPLAELSQLGLWETNGFTPAQIAVLHENYWRSGLVFPGWLVILFAGFLNGIQGFIYLHSRRKVDFYHSLPVKRQEMFVQKTLTGILYTGIPYCIMILMALGVSAAKGYFSLNIVKLVLPMALVHLVIYLFIYFLTVLAVVLTGKALSCALVLAVFFAYPPCLAGLIQDYRNVFYDTAVYSGDSGIVNLLSEYLSPIQLTSSLAQECNGPGFVKYLIWVVLLGAAAGVLSLVIYMRRKSECAGQPLISTRFARVIKYMVTIPFALGVAEIFHSLFGGYTDGGGVTGWIWWIGGLVLGTVLVHGTLEVIYQGDFRKFFSAKFDLAAIAAVVALCFFWYAGDVGHYDTYIPDREEMKAFYMQQGMPFYVYNSRTLITREDDGYRLSDDWDIPERSLIPQGEQMSEELYELLEEIVAQHNDVSEPAVGNYTVKYELNSGRKIARNYLFTKDQLYRMMLCDFRDANLKATSYSFLNLGDECLGQTVQGRFIDRTQTIISNEPEKYKKLMEAMRQDVEEASPEELLEQPVGILDLTFVIPENGSVSVLAPGDEDFALNEEISVELLPCFERTIDLIRDWGYFETLKAEEISSIRVDIAQNNTEEPEVAVTTYEDPEQIEALLDCLVPYSLECPWVKYDPHANVYVTFKNESEIAFLLLQDGIPDFLNEWIEENSADALIRFPETVLPEKTVG